MAAAETPSEAYDRGEIAGIVETRLKDLDRHLEHIDENVNKMQWQLNQQQLSVQRLMDLSASNALHDKMQDSKLRDVRQASHANIEKLSWAIGAIIAVVGIIFTLIVLLG